MRTRPNTCTVYAQRGLLFFQ